MGNHRWKEKYGEGKDDGNSLRNVLKDESENKEMIMMVRVPKRRQG